MDFHPSRASYRCGNSRHGQGFIPPAMPHAFPLTNPLPSLLSCTILLACLRSKPRFLKHSFTISIYLFRALPTERLPAHTLGNFIILSTRPNHQSTPSSLLSFNPFVTPHNSLIRACGTLSLLLNKHLRSSICIILILDLSFHNIVSLPYIRTGTSNVSWKTSTLKLQIPSIN